MAGLQLRSVAGMHAAAPASAHQPALPPHAPRCCGTGSGTWCARSLARSPSTSATCARSPATTSLRCAALAQGCAVLCDLESRLRRSDANQRTLRDDTPCRVGEQPPRAAVQGRAALLARLLLQPQPLGRHPAAAAASGRGCASRSAAAADCAPAARSAGALTLHACWRAVCCCLILHCAHQTRRRTTAQSTGGSSARSASR